MNQPITSFTGLHRFLSNFYRSPLVHDGRSFPTAEHAYQASKTLDHTLRDRFAFTSDDGSTDESDGRAKFVTPGEAKRAGQRLSLRPDWEAVKVGVMREVLRAKFAEPSLRALLLATGDRDLVEVNDWGDREWGVCRGVGKNLLGKLLVEVRAETRAEVGVAEKLTEKLAEHVHRRTRERLPEGKS